MLRHQVRRKRFRGSKSCQGDMRNQLLLGQRGTIQDNMSEH